MPDWCLGGDAQEMSGFMSFFGGLPTKITKGKVYNILWATIRLTSIESIRVPAGSFSNCLRLEHRHENGDLKTVLWLARRIGIVKFRSPRSSNVSEYIQGELVYADIDGIEYGTYPQ